MVEFKLDPSETKIESWTVIYIAPDGGRYNGKLTVTNKRLLYDAKFDVSPKGLVEEALFIKFGSEGYLTIPKERITNVETKKSFIKKQVIITLDNGQVHIFDYGMLNIDKLAEAILQK
jgi:hypothetical protein